MFSNDRASDGTDRAPKAKQAARRADQPEPLADDEMDRVDGAGRTSTRNNLKQLGLASY